MTTAVQLAQSVAPGVSLGFKNRIINGGMVIDQRNAGASTTPVSDGYFIDRWRDACSQTSKFTRGQNLNSVALPAGYSNYLGVQIAATATVGASDYFAVGQRVEGFNVADFGWGTANAQTVTLSFLVRSNTTGTFGGALQNSAQNRSYPFTYSINAANTWEQKSVTIPGDTTGTWLTNNGVGIQLWFGLGVGSTFSGTAGAWGGANYFSATGATSLMGSTSNVFYITGVQLEVGTAATSFEFRDYGRELIMCQRYCYSLGKTDSNTYYAFGVSTATSTTSTFGIIKFPVNMRTVPSFTSSAANTFFADPGVTNWTNIVLDQMSDTTGIVLFTGGSGTSAGYGGRLLANAASGAYIIWSAEL